MIQRLVVMWRDEAPRRHAIGQLWREGGGYAFAYQANLPKDFRLLPEFRDHRTEPDAYRSPYLFATFSQRIPAPSRPDRVEILDRWGVRDADDQLEILSRSGGLQATDALELAEARPPDDDLARPLWFRAAGTRHHAGASRVAVGDHLQMVPEPSNEWDPDAVKLLLPDGLELGYVPRPYTEVLSAQLSRGTSLVATVERQLVLPEQYGRWVVRVERAA